jgi:hypothetical protein
MRTCLPGRSATPDHTLECGGNALLLNHEQTRRRSGRSSPLTTASGIANAAPVC